MKYARFAASFTALGLCVACLMGNTAFASDAVQARSADALQWPSGDYASMSAQEQDAYYDTLAAQLQPGEYIVLPGGTVVENAENGHMTPTEVLAAWQGVSLTETVGDYTLQEVQFNFRASYSAEAGAKTIYQYEQTLENVTGVTLVYKNGNQTLRVVLMGLSELPKPTDTFALENNAVEWGTYDGLTRYGRMGTTSGFGSTANGCTLQVNGTAASMEEFLSITEPFAQLEAYPITYQAAE